MSAENPDLSASAAAKVVRYSLPALLAELKLERTTGGFSQEKIGQTEISKLFTSSHRRRVKNKK